MVKCKSSERFKYLLVILSALNEVLDDWVVNPFLHWYVTQFYWIITNFLWHWPFLFLSFINWNLYALGKKSNDIFLVRKLLSDRYRVSKTGQLCQILELFDGEDKFNKKKEESSLFSLK